MQSEVMFPSNIDNILYNEISGPTGRRSVVVGVVVVGNSVS
jgi:hypothetical protein